MVAHYYRNVNAVVFVYDLTNLKSFADLPNWIEECRKNGVYPQDVPHILIGNKCDNLQSSDRCVKTDQAQIYADKNDMPLFETSALADSEADHVESIFMTLVHKLKEAKPMLVGQTNQAKEASCDQNETLVLKAADAADLADQQQLGWCC